MGYKVLPSQILGTFFEEKHQKYEIFLRKFRSLLKVRLRFAQIFWEKIILRQQPPKFS
jgi:hypothetical protein